jgi:stearoyl-CoA desaturase (delta-9 desaturase)
MENYTDIFQVFLWYQICGLGVTAGLHRLWSHKSYKAKTPTKVLLMILASASNQGSIYHWSRDHRVHHKFSDTDADPHNINRGFFYSHVGWILLKTNKLTIEEGKKLDLSDLEDDKIVMLDKYLWPYDDIFFCYILPGIYTYIYYDSFMKGLFLFGFLRWTIQSHATWCVNSVAHSFGDRPFRKDIKPAENKWISLVALGEGWHNWHHTYPYDYACSDEGIFLRWNPTKLFIDVLGFFGQTYDHKRKVISK